MEIRKLQHDATELTFEPIKEGWNEYKLSDGSILRIRPIVFKVFETSQRTISGDPLIGYAAANVTNVRIGESIKKNIDSIIDPAIESRTIVEFEVHQENWNEYNLENSYKLKVKLVVSKIVRTSRINQFGEPVYIVSSNNVADVQSIDNSEVERF